MKDTLLTADELHSSQQGRSVPGQQSSMKAFTINENCHESRNAVVIQKCDGSLLIQCKC